MTYVLGFKCASYILRGLQGRLYLKGGSKKVLKAKKEMDTFV